MPGAGFFPLFLGLTLGVLSIMLLVQSLASPAPDSKRLWPEQPAVFYLVGSLVAAVWLFERAGFPIAMALFLGVAMRALGTKSWATVVVGALVGTVTVVRRVQPRAPDRLAVRHRAVLTGRAWMPGRVSSTGFRSA